MNTPTEASRGTQKSQTYVPEAKNRHELLDFAETVRQIEAHLAQHSGKAALVDPQGKERPIPDEIFRILEQVANALASGKGITVVPQGMAMTTQQAADFLGVSRPTLVRLLESGAIDFDKPGRHRRVQLQNLIDYQTQFRAERRAALRELARDNLDAKVQVGEPTSLKRRQEFADE